VDITRTAPKTRGMTPYFFGYGSLAINRSTHAYPRRPAGQPSCTGAPALGSHRQGIARSFSGVLPEKRTPVIDGGVDAGGAWLRGSWVALDTRETKRTTASRSNGAVDTDTFPPPTWRQLFQCRRDTHVDIGGPTPFLLSYMDVVVQGVRAITGSTRAAVSLTRPRLGQTPILNDPQPEIPARAQAILPRRKTAAAWTDNSDPPIGAGAVATSTARPRAKTSGLARLRKPPLRDHPTRQMPRQRPKDHPAPRCPIEHARAAEQQVPAQDQGIIPSGATPVGDRRIIGVAILLNAAFDTNNTP